ncbi:alpha/beta fold hydrolase [Reyranella sp. CPCC 100927]|uniref:alpha/beta fold hydrolase n=1 Tax=Reyranella sp. CPCC 100927 TaxID=2599616 RepID=UPI0011B73C7F|nr:alpha/beta fold hydrolase [Reyranella sp. CPCC 100927]TWT01179.1 alpha/beta hydrolase [Reyranella sp. CPCC 100927]
MTPVVFGGCFGWLHPAAGNRGVVLCAPHGYEETSVHRAWGALADRLAAAGLPTLRFDYHGTGDSVGSDEDPQRLRAWLDSIRDAVHWMRQQVGVTEVALVGLRLGGALAALAAKELGDVDMLAMLVPTISGRAYTREMKALAAFSPMPDNAPPPPSPDDIEAGGFVLSAETVEALKGVDLRQIDRLPAPRVLFMPANDGPPERTLAQALRNLGAEVEVVPFDGFEEFICEVYLGQRTPEASFATLTAWLTADAPAALTANEPRQTARLELPQASETPIFFGDEARLFGICCEPRPENADRTAPAVIFINTGHHRRIGANRMAVSMGRRLAARGITSMRIDIAGLGDSQAWQGRPENKLYDKAACADVRAAMDCLEAQGHRECVLIGLCSGAYVSFYTALQDTRVIGQVMINLQRFIWRDGDSLAVTTRVSSTRMRDLGREFRGGIRKVEALRRLLKGSRKEWTTVRALLRRTVDLTRSEIGKATHALFGVEGEVARGFRLMSQLGTDSLLVYCVDDPGLVELEMHNLRIEGRRLAGQKRVGVEMIDGADHTLTRRWARDRLVEIIEAYMVTRRRPVLQPDQDTASNPSWKPAQAA